MNDFTKSPDAVTTKKVIRAWIYLVSNFAFGTCYFIILIVGFTVALCLSIFAIGLPLLSILFSSVRRLAILDRDMTAQVLEFDVLPLKDDLQVEAWWPLNKRLAAYIGSPLTTRSIVYLFAKFGFGITSLVGAILLLVAMLVEWLLNLGGLKRGFVSGRITEQFAIALAEFHTNMISNNPSDKAKNDQKPKRILDEDIEIEYRIGDDGEIISKNSK